MSLTRSLVPTALLLGVLLCPPHAAAQNKCDAGKLKCVAKKKACLLNVETKALKKGVAVDAAKRQKCRDKFDGGIDPSKGCIGKLEGKQQDGKPETLCTVTGDAVSLEATVDAFVDDILTDLVLDYPAVEAPNKCHPALAKCVAKKCKCILKLREKSLKKAEPVDVEKLQKCFDKFFDPIGLKGCVDKVYAKQDPAKPETLCDVPDDGASLEAKVDAFADGIFGAVITMPTPTPTPTLTPTPTPTCSPGGGFEDRGLTVFDCDTRLEWEKKTAGNVGDTYTWTATGTAADGTAFATFLPAVAAALGGSACVSPYDCTSEIDAIVTCATPPPDGCWRVPEIDELLTIVDTSVPGCGPLPSPLCIDPIFGPSPTHSWSATTQTSFPFDAWVGLFENQVFSLGDGTKLSARPVRAVRSEP